MSTDACCGSLLRVSTDIIADRAAGYVVSYQSPRALVIDIKLRVWMVIPDEGAILPTDWVGTYNAHPHERRAVKQLILDDLLYEMVLRGHVIA